MHSSSVDKAVANFSSNLPVEIISHILFLLDDPLEVIRLQSVSKQFHTIICNQKIYWRTLYADACLPRPPGPFPWQSANFLRRTLVQSGQLEQQWISQPLSVTRVHSLSIESSENHGDPQLVGSRWFICQEGSSQLVLRDVDTGHEQKLCQLDQQIKSWSATRCEGSTRGLLLYVLICVEKSQPPDGVQLLEFQADADAAEPLSGPVTYAVPVNDSRSLSLTGGGTRFVLVQVRGPLSRVNLEYSLIFDTENQLFYEFPNPSPFPDTRLCWRIPAHLQIYVMLSASHIILFHPVHNKHTLVQAYVIPDDNETHRLRFSHEAFAATHPPGSWILLRDSVLDPLTGLTSLRAMNTGPSWPSNGHVCLECIDITLPANPTEDVMPMSVDTHTVAIPAPAVRAYSFHGTYIQSSLDGFARGVWLLHDNGSLEHALKFTLDVSDDWCGVEVSEECPHWPAPYLMGRELMFFDATRGRMCFIVDQEDTYAIMLDVE